MKKILFATSECVPFIKTGGLADVVGSLPKCFDKRYFECRVVLPKYMCISAEYRDKMEYVGQISNKSSKTIMSGVKTNEELIKKVCTRALDKNIADLQHSFPDFRIKAPLVSTSPLSANIGMKEDVTEDSRFEVLERSIDDNGCIRYKRVGIIRPVKDKIWDNRFMAVEEEAPNATLGATTFEKVSGGNFYAGMLIREIK